MAPPPVGRSSPTASPAPAPPPHHSLPLQRFRHQRHQHDLGAAVLGGFAEPEVIRARGDFRVCLDEVVGDLEAIGRRVGKGGHLRVPDFPPQLVVLVGTKGVDVHDVRLHPRGQCHLDSGVILPCAVALELSRRFHHDFFLFVGRLFILVPSIVDHRGARGPHRARPVTPRGGGGRRCLGWASLRTGRGGSSLGGRVGSAPCCTHVTTCVRVVRALPTPPTSGMSERDFERDFSTSVGRQIFIENLSIKERSIWLVRDQFVDTS